jgi:general secretion pathway protein G
MVRIRNPQAQHEFPGSRLRSPGGPAGRGFTLIELLVVLSIIALLLTLAVPRYIHSVDVAKEAVLSENLHLVRETIDKFYGDKGRYPESLEELVSERYLRSLPYDPITDSTSTWTIIAPPIPTIPRRQGQGLRHQERRARHDPRRQALRRSLVMSRDRLATRAGRQQPASPTWR